MTFDQMVQSRPGPWLEERTVCYEDAPLSYLFVGALAADSEQQIKARDWYLRRISERVADTSR